MLSIQATPTYLPELNLPLNFSQVYDQYAGALFGIIVNDIGSGEAAEKVLCDAFHKIYHQLPHYQSENARLFTWLLGFVRKELSAFQQS